MINPPVAVALLGLREQLGLRGMRVAELDLVEAELRRLSAVEDGALAEPRHVPRGAGKSQESTVPDARLPHTGDGV